MAETKIKLVVTDLDGTLLSPEKTISAGAAAEIAALKDRGVRFTFITGRPPYAVERFTARIALSAPLVGCNGATIISPEGALLDGYPLDVRPLRALLEASMKQELTVLILIGRTEYALSETAWTRARAAVGRPVPVIAISDLLSKAETYKVNIMAEVNPERFAQLLPQVDRLKERYSIAVYGSYGCEIAAGGVDKGVGLLRLCELCGVRPEEVLAVGDNENDVPMLRMAGVGAAVANAVPSAKAAADYICGSSYTDGVLEAIRRFV